MLSIETNGFQPSPASFFASPLIFVEVESNPNDFEIQKFYKARAVINISLTAISNLITNAPYSKLQDTRIISKRNLEVLEERWNRNYLMLQKLNDFILGSEAKMQKTKSAIEQVNESNQ